MPIDPNALLNLQSLEDLPACDEGIEHARALLRLAVVSQTSLHFRANIRSVDRWFLAGCELFP
jgi:hypothetical protein